MARPLKKIIKALYECTSIIDNGRCVLCGGYRYWTTAGSNGPPQPCQNSECMSHEIDEILEIRTQPPSVTR